MPAFCESTVGRSVAGGHRLHRQYRAVDADYGSGKAVPLHRSGKGAVAGDSRRQIGCSDTVPGGGRIHHLGDRGSIRYRQHGHPLFQQNDALTSRPAPKRIYKPRGGTPHQ